MALKLAGIHETRVCCHPDTGFMQTIEVACFEPKSISLKRYDRYNDPVAIHYNVHGMTKSGKYLFAHFLVLDQLW